MERRANPDRERVRKPSRAAAGIERAEIPEVRLQQDGGPGLEVVELDSG